eukprot:1868920-Karenia_brevis.AAC.1
MLRFSHEPELWKAAILASSSLILQAIRYEVDRLISVEHVDEMAVEEKQIVLDAAATLWRL